MELDELMAEARQESEPPKNPTPMAVTPRDRRLNYSHRGMIDLIIANPGISQNQIAAALGYTPSWVSTVMSSDAFQNALAERSDEIIDPVLKLRMKELIEGAARRSLELLLSKLDRPAEACSENFTLRAFELTSRAAGYGARVEAPKEPAGDVNLHLTIIGERLIELNRRRQQAPLLLEQETTNASSQ